MQVNPHSVLQISYTNHRGESAIRNIVPLRIEFRVSEWHGPLDLWLLIAWDFDKDAVREFELTKVGWL